MIELDLVQWLLAILVVFVGSTIQGIVGYGVGLFSAPLLFLINPMLVPGPLVIVGGLVPLLVLRANRQGIVPRDLAFALPAGGVGVIAAWVLVGLLPATTWQWLFGALIILAVAVSCLRLTIRPTPATISVGTFCSGCMGTITGVGGPPLGVVYQHADPARVRGTLSAIFIPLSVMSSIALVFLDRMGWREVWLAVAMIPAVLGGFWCARHLGARVPRAGFRVFVLGTALIAGVYSVWRGLH